MRKAATGREMETTVEEGESKPKFLEEGKEDRISALPDCLIIEILSRLPSTKEAIRTGTLSKRWEHLWTLLPVLIFNRYKVNLRWPDFVLFIDKTLTKCRQLKLKKFNLHTGRIDDIGFESQVNNWIRYAVRCNIEELALSFWNVGYPHEFLVDQILFNSSCLTDLRLSGCILNPLGEVSWKNLRSLYISDGKLDEDFVKKILSGSPLLETLELHYCSYDYQMLDITAKSLKNLVLCGYMDSDPEDGTDTTYDIRLVSQVNNWIRFAVRCNVEKLSLTLPNNVIEGEYQLDQILFIGSCFTDLSLSVEGCMFNSIGEISWKNLMNLYITYVELDEDLIEKILCGSPQLETLTLAECYGYRRLDMTSKSVKNLVLCRYRDPGNESDDQIIEINAPYILSLTIEDVMFLWKVVLLNVSSLVKANLDYTKLVHYETEEEMLEGFILNLRHVKELKIGRSCSEVLSRLEAKGLIIPSNVRLPTYY